jgi:hypothetical protein
MMEENGTPVVVKWKTEEFTVVLSNDHTLLYLKEQVITEVHCL